MLAIRRTLVTLALVACATAHMSIWTPAMYGVGWENGKTTNITQGNGYFAYDAGDPVSPIGPNVGTQDAWWFRGPGYRALQPFNNSVAQLPAGGTWTVEIACHVAWTSYGVSTTVRGSVNDACPGNSGAFHSGDPIQPTIDPSLLSGCALGIADVDDISKVTMDNFAIFSVNHTCVSSRYTDFQVPALMPACTGKKCICGWMWLANNGTANFYMTGFDCSVTNVSPVALKIAAPVDPVWCAPADKACQLARPTGAKRPLYAYNTPTNIVWQGNNDRPGYHANWGFPIDGAQTDIFHSANVTFTIPSSTPTSTTISSTASSTPASTATASSTSLPSTTSTIPLPTDAVVNLARSAAASASSQNLLTFQLASKAIDGVIGGSTTTNPVQNLLGGLLGNAGNPGAEWASSGQNVGATFSLTWNSPVTFNQLVLYDRPNPTDQILLATIKMADGSSFPITALHNDGSATYFNTTTITTTSLTMTITGTSMTTQNVGLSEFQVFFTPTTDFTTVLTPRSPPSTKAKRAIVPSQIAPRHARDFSVRNVVEERILKESAGQNLNGRALFDV